MKAAMLVLALVAPLAHAGGAYLGGAWGLSKTYSPQDGHCDACTTYSSDYSHRVAKLYGGYQWGPWALELGAGRLSKSTGESTIATRPSNIQGVQKSRYASLSVLRSVRLTDRLQGFGGIGAAYWRFSTDEKGVNCLPEADGTYLTFDNDTRCNRSGYQEFRHEDSGWSPIYTAGAAYKLTERVSVRAWYEQTKIGGKSRWIYEQTARVGWVSLQIGF